MSFFINALRHPKLSFIYYQFNYYIDCVTSHAFIMYSSVTIISASVSLLMNALWHLNNNSLYYKSNFYVGCVISHALTMYSSVTIISASVSLFMVSATLSGLTTFPSCFSWYLTSTFSPSGLGRVILWICSKKNTGIKWFICSCLLWVPEKVENELHDQHEFKIFNNSSNVNVQVWKDWKPVQCSLLTLISF